MSREDVINFLGTIANSGTRRFLDALSGDEKRDHALIGQFGVGFYSSFIVADRVTVLTRLAGSDAAVRWESEGEGSYSLDDAEKTSSGTDVILHLREDEKEFLEPSRLRHLVRKYSDHIGVPVRLIEGDGEPETLNRAAAFWTRPKTELVDADYQAFYTHLTHDPDAPLTWVHQKVEGSLEYTALLYLPKTAPFDLWDREKSHGVQLYVRRVFIMDKASELLPAYLRFIRGLVDSADLPLNVSRELLQGNRAVDKIRGALTKRVLDMLDELARDKPEDYATFWKNFGAVLKEGVVEDPVNRERIAKLLRFATSRSDDKPNVSLDEYVGRMKEDQKAIYYLSADSVVAAKASPHLEGYRARDLEVLLLTDRIDEWLVMHLTEFAGKKLQSCAQGAADFTPKVETAEAQQRQEALKPVLDRLKSTLHGRIAEARVSARLTESPACLIAPEHGLSRRLQELLKQSGDREGLPEAAPILEINPKHPLVERLESANDAKFHDLAVVLYGQAVLAEGGQLEDPAGFVRSLNTLVLGDGDKPSIILTR
jgi:molecular chaperone HtpG